MSTTTTSSAPRLRQRRFWTYEELCAEWEETNQPSELLDGHLIMAPAPTPFHQLIAQRLEEALRRWVNRRRLGVVFHSPVDVVLARDVALQPDILFIAKQRREIIKDYIAGAPDLVMEVVSPDRPRRDYKDKKEKYEAHGVREYWIVDPRRKKIEVWTLTTDFYELAGAFSPGEYAASGLLPGFKIRVDDIFAVAW